MKNFNEIVELTKNALNNTGAIKALLDAVEMDVIMGRFIPLSTGSYEYPSHSYLKIDGSTVKIQSKFEEGDIAGFLIDGKEIETNWINFNSFYGKCATAIEVGNPTREQLIVVIVVLTAYLRKKIKQLKVAGKDFDVEYPA